MTPGACVRCGGMTYLDDDDMGGPAVACLACGELRWDEPPVPWTGNRGVPRLPVSTGGHDE